MPADDTGTLKIIFAQISAFQVYLTSIYGKQN